MGEALGLDSMEDFLHKAYGNGGRRLFSLISFLQYPVLPPTLIRRVPQSLRVYLKWTGVCKEKGHQRPVSVPFCKQNSMQEHLDASNVC